MHEHGAAARVDNLLAAALDGDDHHVVLGGQRRGADAHAAQRTAGLDVVSVHVHLVVRVVVHQHVGLLLDVGAYGRHLVLGANDGHYVGRHQYVVLVGQVDHLLAALDGDDVGAVAVAQVALGEGEACQGRGRRDAQALHGEFVLHAVGYVERGLVGATVEVLVEALLDAGVEAVGPAREEHHGDHYEGDDEEEAHGDVDVGGHHHTHREEGHEVAQHQYRYDDGLAEAIGVEHLLDALLAHPLDGHCPEEGRHEGQRAHQAHYAAPYLRYLEVGEQGV